MGFRDSFEKANFALKTGLLKKEEVFTPKIISPDYQYELKLKALERGIRKGGEGITKGIYGLNSFLSMFKK